MPAPERIHYETHEYLPQASGEETEESAMKRLIALAIVVVSLTMFTATTAFADI